MAEKAVAIGSLAIGSLLTYAGLKGYSIPATLQDIVTGKTPIGQKQTAAIGTPTGSTSSTSGNTAPGAGAGNLVANALSVQGHAYVYGGAPGTDGKDPWDCSSCMNWVVGKLSGLSIPEFPDGSYTGAVHGPATGSWLLFGRSVAPASVQPGDLIVGITHMGMVTQPGEYLSAHDPAEGTTVSPITEFPDVIVYYRRVS